MPAVEIELRRSLCEAFVAFAASMAPIPIPRLNVLGPDRLISKIVWGTTPVIDGGAGAWLGAPPGTLPIRIAASITSVSVDEVVSNPVASGITIQCQAWLLLLAQSGVLRLELRYIEPIGKPGEKLPSPAVVGYQRFDALDAFDAAIGNGSIVVANDVVTVRFPVGNDSDLLAAPLNRLIRDDSKDTWLICIPGTLIARRLSKSMGEALAKQFKKPEPVSVSSLWVQNTHAYSLILNNLGVPPGSWCALGIAEVNIDVPDPFTASVAVSAALQVHEDTKGKLTWSTRSYVDADVWNFIPLYSGDLPVETVETDVPVMPLPFGSPTVSDAGPEGIIVTGNAIYLSVEQRSRFSPDGGPLSGERHSQFRCGGGGTSSYEVSPIIVETWGVGVSGSEPIPVRIFGAFFIPNSLSTAAFSAAKWFVSAPSMATYRPVVKPHHQGAVSVGESCFLVLHTSAGVRRFDLGPTPRLEPVSPDIPELQLLDPPSLDIREIQRLFCIYKPRGPFVRDPIAWLPVEPPYNRDDLPPLRQWQFSVQDLETLAKVTLHTRVGGEDVSYEYDLERGSSVLEIVCDRDAELMLEHTLGDSELELRINQRWLLPTEITDSAPGRSEELLIEAIKFNDAVYETAMDDARLRSLTTNWKRSGGRLTATLFNGEVVTTWGNKFIRAVPWVRDGVIVGGRGPLIAGRQLSRPR